MFVELECCQKCFMHKQYNHQEWIFYENFCKLDQVIQRKCKLKVLKNAILPPLILQEFQRYNFTDNKLIEKLLQQRKLKFKPRITTFQIKYRGLYIFSLLQSKIFPDYDLIAKIIVILKKANLNGLNLIKIELRNSGTSTIYELAKIKDHNVNQKNIKLNFLQDILIEPNHKRSKIFTSQEKRLCRKQNSLKSLRKGLSQPKIQLSKQNLFVFKKKQENSFLLKPHTTESQSHSRRSMGQKGGYSSVSIQPLIKQSQGQNKKKLKKQIRCRNHENRYSNLNNNRKSQAIINQLPLKEYNKIRQQKFQYLTKQSDVQCDYNPDINFQLQNLSDNNEGESQDCFQNSYATNRFNSFDLIDEICQTQRNKMQYQQSKTLHFQQTKQQKDILFGDKTLITKQSQAISIYSQQKQPLTIVNCQNDQNNDNIKKIQTNISSEQNFNNKEQSFNNIELFSLESKIQINNQNTSCLQEKYQKSTETFQINVQNKDNDLINKIGYFNQNSLKECNDFVQTISFKKQDIRMQQKIDSLQQRYGNQQQEYQKGLEEVNSQKDNVQYKRQNIIKNYLKTQADYFNYFQSCLQNFNTKILQNKSNHQSMKPQQSTEMNSIQEFFNQFYPCPRMILQTVNKKKVIKMIKNLIDQYNVEKESNKQWLQISSLNICKIFFVSENKCVQMVYQILFNMKVPTKTKFYITQQNQQIQQFISLDLLDKQFNQIFFLFYDSKYELKKCQLQIGSKNSTYSQNQNSQQQCLTEQFNVQMRINENLQRKQQQQIKQQPSYHTFISFQMNNSKQINSLIQTCTQNRTKPTTTSTQPKIRIKVLHQCKKQQNIQEISENTIGQIQNKGNFFFQLNLQKGSYLCMIEIIYPCWLQKVQTKKEFNLIFYSQADVQISEIQRINLKS